MNNYTISKASSKDIDRIMVLAAASRQIMKESGNPTQWTDNHPSRETIEEDVERGDCYVISKRGEDDATDSADKGDATDNADSMIVGSFVFRDGPDPSYANIYDGAWIDDTLPYHVIHRVMSLPDAHGIFAEIINFCFQHSKNIRELKADKFYIFFLCHADDIFLRISAHVNLLPYCNEIYH